MLSVKRMSKQNILFFFRHRTWNVTDIQHHILPLLFFFFITFETNFVHRPPIQRLEMQHSSSYPYVASFYQISHLLSGFIFDPLGQLYACANSSEFARVPRTLNRAGECASSKIWRRFDSGVPTEHQTYREKYPFFFCLKMILERLILQIVFGESHLGWPFNKESETGKQVANQSEKTCSFRIPDLGEIIITICLHFVSSGSKKKEMCWI